MSAIENAIERVIEYHETNCNGGINSPCNLSIDARAELAALREEVNQFAFLLVANNAASASDLGGEIDSLRADSREDKMTIGAQAATIDQLRAERDDQAETIRLLECQIAWMEQAMNEARVAMTDYDAPDFSLAEALRTIRDDCISPNETIWRKWLSKQAEIIEAWLAAHPAPAPEEQAA